PSPHWANRYMATDNRGRFWRAAATATLRKTPSMNRARKVTGLAARGVALVAAFAAAAAPTYALAQDTAQPSPPAAAPAEGQPANAAAAPAAPPPGLSESVAAVVNDDIISTYDLAMRMRLLIATSGIQPTQQN